MNRVVVTGAAGFIGSHLCEAMAERGTHIVGVDAFTSFYDPDQKRANLARLLTSSRFDLVEADVASAPLAEVFDGADAVVHLAGEPGVTTSWGPDFARYVERNVLATQRVLEAVGQLGIPRLVYASSSSVYGAPTDTLRARGEPRPTSPYGVSKLAGEALVGAYAASAPMTTVSLRYFSVYGPRQRPDMAAHRFIEAMLDGRAVEVFGDGGQVRDFTFVGDVVDATIRAITADVPPAAVLDIASASPVAVTTLIDLLERIVTPGGIEVHRAQERRGDVPRTSGRIELTHQHLGWEPTVDLATGLARQVDWHRQRRGAAPPVRQLSPVAGGGAS
jgi:nucleoside-diphosphate-sugar epimerase